MKGVVDRGRDVCFLICRELVRNADGLRVFKPFDSSFQCATQLLDVLRCFHFDREDKGGLAIEIDRLFRRIDVAAAHGQQVFHLDKVCGASDLGQDLPDFFDRIEIPICLKRE